MAGQVIGPPIGLKQIARFRRWHDCTTSGIAAVLGTGFTQKEAQPALKKKDACSDALRLAHNSTAARLASSAKLVN
jgi:hypothetical protein